MVIGVEVDKVVCNLCSACDDYLPGIFQRIKQSNEERLSMILDPRHQGMEDMRIGQAVCNCVCGAINPLDMDMKD